MPNIKSAKKRVEVIKKKTMRNNSIKSGYKTAIKKAEAAIESKNMEDCRDRRFPLRDSRFLNDRIESCSKLSYANCSKVSCIYTTYLYITYSSLSDHVLPHQRPQVIR